MSLLKDIFVFSKDSRFFLAKGKRVAVLPLFTRVNDEMGGKISVFTKAFYSLYISFKSIVSKYIDSDLTLWQCRLFKLLDVPRRAR